MAIRSKLTTRGGETQGQRRAPTERKDRTEEEKAAHKARIQGAKDALARSATLKGEHVAPARAALKDFLRNINDDPQPDDGRFQLLLEAPFRVPPKPRPSR